MSLCDNRPWPGEPVIVAVPEATARSHVVLPALLGRDIQNRFPYHARFEFGLGRLRRRTEVLIRHHKPKNFTLEQRTNRRYRQIFCAGIVYPRVHTSWVSLLTEKSAARKHSGLKNTSGGTLSAVAAAK
jgi:hypothetical protein